MILSLCHVAQCPNSLYRTRTTNCACHLGGTRFSIHIGRDLCSSAPGWLQSQCGQSRHAVIVFDQNVESIADRYGAELKQAGYRLTRLAVPSGEAAKSIAEATRLWDAMLANHTDRGSLVIAGGGVVGDLAGFVGCFLCSRIVPCANSYDVAEPVNSSVGGKTGVNLPRTKNVVRAFWQPSLVIIDTASLDGLLKREFVSGLAEVVKYGVILIPDLLNFLEQNVAPVLGKDPPAIAHLVSKSCQAKASVVQQDEREPTGLRAILNYGHTFAHALESVAGYGKLLHGEAVSIGMHIGGHSGEIT